MLEVGEGTPTRVSPRRANTRERLITAAMHVFAERGVNGASVEEICEAAGFTRGLSVPFSPTSRLWSWRSFSTTSLCRSSPPNEQSLPSSRLPTYRRRT